MPARRTSRLALFLLLALAAPARARSLPEGKAAERFVPGRIVVRLRAPTPSRDTFAGARIVRFLDGDEGRTLLLAADDRSEPATLDLHARLAARPEVAWAEREHVRQRSGLVDANDPLFPQQWALALAHLPAAWSRTEGSPAVTVAVLDTGIGPHPDLAPRYLGGWDFVTDEANAGDGDGRDSDPTDPGTVDDASSGLHGIHVTGILAAHTDNQVGIAGVDWRCRVLPVRVLGVLRGTGNDSDISDGLRWAVGLPVAGAPQNPTPARVVNMSFGGPGGSQLIQSAVDDAIALGAIVVAAAGNDASDASTYAPAGLDHVIAVGACDDAGRLASYSNRGPRVDLLAPGGDLANGAAHGVLSTLYRDGDGWTYVAMNGTSQAAPHAAGVAALMKAIDPSLGGDRARALLAATADPSGACKEGCGGGLLDADAALAAVEVGCADGHCVRAAIGVDVYAGCALARSRGTPWPALLALLALLGARRQTRA